VTDDEFGIGAQPRCPDDGVLMRDDENGWICPACGCKLPAPPVAYPDFDDVIDLPRRPPHR
jgi:hypothetical protein